MKDETPFVAVAIFELLIQRNGSLHDSHPTHLRADDRRRLAFNQCLRGQIVDLRRFREFGPSGAPGSRAAEFFLDLRQIRTDPLPLEFFAVFEVIKFAAFKDQIIALSPELRFLQFPQISQPHVQDCFRLLIHQFEFGDQDLLGMLLVSDDFNHAIQVEVGDYIALEHQKPCIDLLKPVLGSPLQNLALVVEKRLQQFLERANFGRPAVDQSVHVH